MHSIYLAHHGIKGQKWGVRRFQNPDGSLTNAGKKRYLDLENSHMDKHMSFKSKNGDTIELDKMPPSILAKGIARISPKYADNVRKNSLFEIKVNGKRVGDLELNQNSKSELNVVWIGIDDEHRGKGYASAVMKNVKEYAKESGNRKLTLEVPGNSPDARHIYEKQGFKAVAALSEKDVWGGLTAMELPLYEDRVSLGSDFISKRSH